MKRAILVAGTALLSATSACGPAAAPGDVRSSLKQPSAAPARDVTKPATGIPGAAGILGKVKEPVGLVRQAAFVHSLHDALPVSLASGGFAQLGAASSLVSNNGGGVVSNNGGVLISDSGGNVRGGAPGAWRLFQHATVFPESVRVRSDAVYRQSPDGMTTGLMTVYDVKTYDKTPGADNTASIMDRFRYAVVDLQQVEGGGYSFDFELTVVSSKRLSFVEKLVVRQTGRPDPVTGGFVNEKMEYLVGFDLALVDGETDHADLHLTAVGADLIRDKRADGTDIRGSEVPARMTLEGTNRHGTYTGEVKFPAGGDIVARQTHTREGGGRTEGEVTLRTDGSSRQVATSLDGRLKLAAERDAAGRLTLEVTDIAGDAPLVLPDAVKEVGGIGTFDFGEPEKPRARLY